MQNTTVRRYLLYALLVVAFLVALFVAATGTTMASPIGTWSSRADTVRLWKADDATTTAAFFDPGVRYRMAGMEPGVGNALTIHSLAGFADRAPLLRDGMTVMLNLEAETVTPFFQQTHPRWMMRRFVRIAHANGLVAVLAPSRSLVGPDPGCTVFLECGYLEIAADAFHLQAQKLECDLPAFVDFVSRAKAQAASALIVQLTVGWLDPCVTPEAVRDAWQAALPYADGFALWGSADDEQNAKGLEAMRLIAS
jgi:hypothetical protein